MHSIDWELGDHSNAMLLKHGLLLSVLVTVMLIVEPSIESQISAVVPLTAG